MSTSEGFPASTPSATILSPEPTAIVSPGEAQTSSGSARQLGLAISRKRLRETESPSLEDTVGQATSETAESAIKNLLTAAKESHHQESTAIKQLQGILTSFDIHSRVVDMKVQYSPEIGELALTCLRAAFKAHGYPSSVGALVRYDPEVTFRAWAGIRGPLQVALNKIDAANFLLAASAFIAAKMTIAREWEKSPMFLCGGGGGSSSKTAGCNLQEIPSPLQELYASIFIFSMRVNEYLEPSNSRFKRIKCASTSLPDYVGSTVDEDLQHEEHQNSTFEEIMTAKSISR
ncbi:hypothetical protein DFH27DRAFT_44333 [Peziza echinospora]|nr:hypothetical protein DFH27DRAFT_44333 [Peziza echinospora]